METKLVDKGEQLIKDNFDFAVEGTKRLERIMQKGKEADIKFRESRRNK